MLARMVLSLKLKAPNTTFPSGEIPAVATVLPGPSPFVVAAVVADAVEAAPESSLLVHDATQSASAIAIAMTHDPRRATSPPYWVNERAARGSGEPRWVPLVANSVRGRSAAECCR